MTLTSLRLTYRSTPHAALLLVEGTSLDATASVSIAAEAVGTAEAVAVLPAHLLHELVKRSPGEVLTLDPGAGYDEASPGVLLRSGSFSFHGRGLDPAAYPVLPTLPEGVAWSEPLPVAEVRRVLSGCSAERGAGWEGWAYLLPGGMASYDGARIASARLTLPDALHGLAVPGRAGAALACCRADTVRLAAVGEDGAALAWDLPHGRGSAVLHLRGSRSYAAPDALAGVLADVAGEALGELPPVGRWARVGKGRNERRVFKPLGAAGLRRIARAGDLLLVGVLPDGTYQGLTSDGGGTWAESGNGAGLPGRVAVLAAGALEVVGASGAGVYESSGVATGGGPIYRTPAGAVGALGARRLAELGERDVPGVIALDEWRELGRDLRRGWHLRRIEEAGRAVGAALRMSDAGRIEAGPVFAAADMVGELVAAAAGEGHAVPDGHPLVMRAAREALHGARAWREKMRSAAWEAARAYMVAAVYARDLGAATVPPALKSGKPGRITAAARRRLDEARAKESRAGEHCAEVVGQWAAAARHAGRVADLVTLLEQGRTDGDRETAAAARSAAVVRALLGAPGNEAARVLRVAGLRAERDAARLATLRERLAAPVAVVAPDPAPAPQSDPVTAEASDLPPAGPEGYRWYAVTRGGMVLRPDWFTGGRRMGTSFAKRDGVRDGVTVQASRDGALLLVHVETGDGGRALVCDAATLGATLRNMGITGRYAEAARSLAAEVLTPALYPASDPAPVPPARRGRVAARVRCWRGLRFLAGGSARAWVTRASVTRRAGGAVLGWGVARPAPLPLPLPLIRPRVVGRAGYAARVRSCRAGLPLGASGARSWALGARWARLQAVRHLGALEALAAIPAGELLALGARVASGDPVAVGAARAAGELLAVLGAGEPWRVRRGAVVLPSPVPVFSPAGGGAPTPPPLPDMASGTPACREASVRVASGVLRLYVYADGAARVVLPDGRDLAGRVDARGRLTGACGWAEVAGQRALEVRGVVLELARAVGVAK